MAVTPLSMMFIYVVVVSFIDGNRTHDFGSKGAVLTYGYAGQLSGDPTRTRAPC